MNRSLYRTPDIDTPPFPIVLVLTSLAAVAILIGLYALISSSSPF